ncbi:hypothetical protein HBA54_20730 [Pelagibius litoralis]|uniref:Heparinase superfamily protein n=1 Tax=Pelagibius litoralis TaxID=374515 RepID=A0A967F0Z9_9PROT|nr:hypothetical protein [Pelagibius litoralis]
MQNRNAVAVWLETYRQWRLLPRDLALDRLAYGLRRPLFALPEAPWHRTGTPPASVIMVPPDPWPGKAERGAAIVEDNFRFLGRSLHKPAPRWAPLGMEPAWLKRLHGFGWLRDLRAAGGDAPRRKARSLVADWIDANQRWSPIAWHPVVTADRLAHWFSQYEFFAASAEVSFRQTLLASAARQARHLARVLPAGLSGADLITAAKGLCYAGLCLPQGEPWLDRGLALLAQALEEQLLADGGQCERAPALLLSILRDCIDLRAALLAAGREVPGDLSLRIEGMVAVLRLLQHGDGGLALFNGSNEGEDLQIDMILQRGGGKKVQLQSAPSSGFQRLQAGRSLMLVDAGRPAAPGYDRAAHAGTLSFEMSVGRERLIVNCGAQDGEGTWQAAQRTTAAHSTLVLAETNSAALFASGGLYRRAETVTCRRNEDEGAIWLEASHDGYLPLFDLTHHRRLYLAASGEDLRGEDCLKGQAKGDPSKDGQDLAFAIRFHLHPEVQAMAAQDGRSAVLRLPKGGGWRLRAAGATVDLEPSVYLGVPGKIRRSQQIVLSGTTGGRSQTAEGCVVKWALQRLGPGS